MVDCDQDVQPNEPFPLQVGFGHDVYHRNGKQTDMYAYLVLYTHTTIRKETDIISNPYKPHKIFHKNPKSNTGSSAAGFQQKIWDPQDFSYQRAVYDVVRLLADYYPDARGGIITGMRFSHIFTSLFSVDAAYILTEHFIILGSNGQSDGEQEENHRNAVTSPLRETDQPEHGH